MSAKNILITGASSGIGAAIARALAGPDSVLVLWGRDQVRLEATAQSCRARGAVVELQSIDLVDGEALVAGLEDVDGRYPLDLAIFNAGLGGSLPPDRVAQDPRAAARMAAVNFVAPVIGSNLLADRMASRGHGRIVLVGSVAGAFPLPMAPVYSGTKAGLAMFADALRARLRRHGIGVTLVSPGFVDTPMSQGLKEPRPFLIDPDTAAATIVRGINRGVRHIVVPWQFAAIMAVAGLIPGALVRAVLARF